MIVSELDPEKRELALKLGAARVVDSSKEDLHAIMDVVKTTYTGDPESMAKAAGAYTVALTGIGKNPISKETDITIHIAAEKTIFQSESVSTRIAQLVVLDTLVGLIAIKDYDRSNEAALSTRRATSNGKV